MSQIFHRSLNTVSRVSIFGAIFLIAAAVAIAGIVVRSPYMTEAGVVRAQPVPFSHRHHVGDVGLDCRYCHQTVENSAFAGLPASEVCLDCHSQLWADSEMLAPVRASVQSGEPLRWSRVHDIPDYSYFHHGIHVRKGIACEVCHGPVDDMALMYREESLHMEWCLDCHRQPEKYIRPRESVFQIGWEEPHQGGKSPQQLVEDYHVRTRTNCSTCHR